MTDTVNNATPTIERCVTSYPARRAYSPYILRPPAIPDVTGIIDIHCHAAQGQQDALSVAKLASENGMGGLLFKSLGPYSALPMDELNGVTEALARWADETGVAPIDCWVGDGVVRSNRKPDPKRVREQIEAGVTAFWLPVNNSANTYSIVGGKPIWWDRSADPDAHTEPMSWEDALKYGFYMLDDKGRLKPEFEECIRIIADSDCALSFAHSSHPEIWAVAELVDKLKFKRAFVDHPFSPFVNLSIDEMKQLASIGVYLNFTFDELSPLLGVDPAKMYAAIRAVGVEHFTLSSDAGEPLFPNSVECMRLIRGYMQAFGMSDEELDVLCVQNPSKIVGLLPA